MNAWINEHTHARTHQIYVWKCHNRTSPEAHSPSLSDRRIQIHNPSKLNWEWNQNEYYQNQNCGAKKKSSVGLMHDILIALNKLISILFLVSFNFLMTKSSQLEEQISKHFLMALMQMRAKIFVFFPAFHFSLVQDICWVDNYVVKSISK